MIKATLILIVFMSAVSVPLRDLARPDHDRGQEQTRALSPQERAIKITIATAGSFFGPPTDRYKVGDQIPVAITMTNTSDAPVNVCLSADLYQNLPTLTRNGAEVPYMKWQSYERLNAQRNHICESDNMPETVILRPNQPSMADWFVLSDTPTSTGAEAWYDPLPAGKYELSIQRRFGCCNGPMVESNKISFEVTP